LLVTKTIALRWGDNKSPWRGKSVRSYLILQYVHFEKHFRRIGPDMAENYLAVDRISRTDSGHSVEITASFGGISAQLHIKTASYHYEEAIKIARSSLSDFARQLGLTAASLES
jgi:hypothetical protein